MIHKRMNNCEIDGRYVVDGAYIYTVKSLTLSLRIQAELAVYLCSLLTIFRQLLLVSKPGKICGNQISLSRSFDFAAPKHFVIA